MSLVREKSSADAALDESASTCCARAIEAEERGDYSGALEALRPFFDAADAELRLDGLSDLSKAKLSLRSGALTSRIGANKGLKESQEAAKNLLDSGIQWFARAGDADGVAEAKTYLAACYFILGETDEARIVLTDALADREGLNCTTVVKANVWLAIVEYGAHRFFEALKIHQQTKELLANVQSHYLLGTFHNEHGKTWEAIGKAGDNEEHLDRALMEYTAAAYHFEQAGHKDFLARVTNNHGLLLLGLKRHTEALAQFDKARNIFHGLHDTAIVDRVDVNRARAYCELGKHFGALKIIRQAVARLEGGEQAARLAEALTVQGTILARAGNGPPALRVFMRAAETAGGAGNREAAGAAYLGALEEVTGLPADEMADAYEKAKALLGETQDGTITRRLLAVSGRVVEAMGKKAHSEAVAEAWGGVSFYAARDEFERELITKAMKAAGGNTAEASRLLAFDKPQRLYQLLGKHNLKHLQSTHLKRSIIKDEPESNVSDLHSYIEFTLPAGVTQSDVCAIHQITTDVLTPFGARPGDFALVLVCDVVDGELVGVDVGGEPYRVGFLTTRGGYVSLMSRDGRELLPAALRETVNVEGKVVGYLKSEDVAAYRKGRAVQSHDI